MWKIFMKLIDTVNEIDRKIVKDFDNPKIEITAEMVELYRILEQAAYQVKTFKIKAETYAANNP